MNSRDFTPVQTILTAIIVHYDGVPLWELNKLAPQVNWRRFVRDVPSLRIERILDEEWVLAAPECPIETPTNTFLAILDTEAGAFGQFSLKGALNILIPEAVREALLPHLGYDVATGALVLSNDGVNRLLDLVELVPPVWGLFRFLDYCRRPSHSGTFGQGAVA